MKKKQKKQNKHSVLLRRLILVLLGLLLGVNAYLANASALTGNRMPMPFGTGMAVVLSGSMEPTLSVNDVILVREKEEYRVGDIVVYQSARELIVHRIISADGDTVTTQGDANETADTPIDRSAIKGVVVAHIPLLGILVNALKTPAGILLILICAFALVELSFRRQKQEDSDETEAIKEEIRKLRTELDEKPDDKNEN